MKWCLSNQFDIKDIIYQADKTKLSDIKIFLIGTNNSVKPDLGNTNKTTATTTTTIPPTTAISAVTITTITAATPATLGQNSNSEDVPVIPECKKTPSNITYELIKLKTMQILQSLPIAPIQKNYQTITLNK